MLSHRICIILLVVLCAIMVTGSNAINEDSDEDDKLKQALVLVDLLKLEYAKALRENYMLRNRETPPQLVEDSTCAVTDEPIATHHQPSATLSVPQQIGIKNYGPWRRMFGGKQASENYPEQAVYYPENFFRRRIPADYYFDYPIRRREPIRHMSNKVIRIPDNRRQNNEENKSEIKEENKEANKEEVKDENKAINKEANKEEDKEENKEEDKEENKETNKEEDKEENKETTKEEDKEENKEKNKEENKETNKEEDKETNKEENKETIKEEDKENNKERNKEEDKEKNKETNKEENKDKDKEANKEYRDKSKEENKEEIKHENKEDKKQENKEENKQENKDDKENKSENKQVKKTENKEETKKEKKGEKKKELLFPISVKKPEIIKMDPIKTQIAMAVEDEMKNIGTQTQNNNPKVTTTASSIFKQIHMYKLVRPTMKIHLARSTRYPLPLPENHAFCYTNPRNALCRTVI